MVFKKQYRKDIHVNFLMLHKKKITVHVYTMSCHDKHLVYVLSSIVFCNITVWSESKFPITRSM